VEGIHEARVQTQQAVIGYEVVQACGGRVFMGLCLFSKQGGGGVGRRGPSVAVTAERPKTKQMQFRGLSKNLWYLT